MFSGCFWPYFGGVHLIGGYLLQRNLDSEDPQLQIWMSTLDLETHDLVQLSGT